MLKLDNVVIKFGGLVAINHFSFEMQEGQIYSIIGPNGAGKTTLFNCISRFYNMNEGSIMFDGHNLADYKSHHLAKLGIARSFQNTELFSRMTVLGNLLAAQHLGMNKNIIAIGLRLPKIRKQEKAARVQAMDILKMLGMDHLANEIVGNLSFGYQKMVDIARTIMMKPKLILLDEPVAGMNNIETEKIKELILRLRDEMNISVLLIEHDMSLVMQISDYITVMNFGQKIAEGIPEEIQNDPVVIEAYLGEASNSA